MRLFENGTWNLQISCVRFPFFFFFYIFTIIAISRQGCAGFFHTSVECDIFILKGVYGDVVRVKILFNKKDTALVQFVDGVQAQRGNIAISVL